MHYFTAIFFAIFVVSSLVEAYVVPSSQNERPSEFDVQRALDDLEDVQTLLDVLKGREYNSNDNMNSFLAAYQSSLGSRIGGGRTFNNRLFGASSLKPQGQLSSARYPGISNLRSANGGSSRNGGSSMLKRNYNLDHLARMNFRRSFRASKFNDRHILGGL